MRGLLVAVILTLGLGAPAWATEYFAAIADLPRQYSALLADIPDDDFRREITLFGFTTSLGAFIVNQALCGCAAYRTQLFLYLKACGREELSTMNLWAGIDAVAAV